MHRRRLLLHLLTIQTEIAPRMNHPVMHHPAAAAAMRMIGRRSLFDGCDDGIAIVYLSFGILRRAIAFR